MRRVLEPELMETEEQAEAYAKADFVVPHSRIVDRFCTSFPGRPNSAYVLDLGCGPADITIRLARANPDYTIHGVDGSVAMLDRAHEAVVGDPDLARRLTFIEGTLPGIALPRSSYDIVFSNSLLHHLHDPGALWRTVKDYGRPDALVYIADLARPDSETAVKAIVEKYSADEPEVLRRDFHNSLCAAFTPDEVRAQLRDEGLDGLRVEKFSDRHLAVAGRLRS